MSKNCGLTAINRSAVRWSINVIGNRFRISITVICYQSLHLFWDYVIAEINLFHWNIDWIFFVLVIKRTKAYFRFNENYQSSRWMWYVRKHNRVELRRLIYSWNYSLREHSSRSFLFLEIHPLRLIPYFHIPALSLTPVDIYTTLQFFIDIYFFSHFSYLLIFFL